MGLKDKLAAAMNKAAQIKKDGVDPKTVAQKEVKAKAKNVYTGPFAGMKAKRAVRKGEAETAFGVKNTISGARVTKEYSDPYGKAKLIKKTKISKTGLDTKKGSSSYELNDAMKRLRSVEQDYKNL